MPHDEQELDLEIRKALRIVDVPVGAKENLLLQLMAASENRTENRIENRIGGESVAPMASLDLEAVGSTVVSASDPVQLYSESKLGRVLSRRRHLQNWGMAISVALIAFAAFVFWPTSASTRLDVLMARHIERIENEPIQWDATVQLPASLRNIMQQVAQLQPLGFADITPTGSLSRIHVYAFRNQEGKQVLLVAMAKPKVRQQFGSQLTPLNSNTGGWSCAAADVQGDLVVLAVPGNRAYLLKHLRNITVT